MCHIESSVETKQKFDKLLYDMWLAGTDPSDMREFKEKLCQF